MRLASAATDFCDARRASTVHMRRKNCAGAHRRRARIEVLGKELRMPRTLEARRGRARVTRPDRI